MCSFFPARIDSSVIWSFENEGNLEYKRCLLELWRLHNFNSVLLDSGAKGVVQTLIKRNIKLTEDNFTRILDLDNGRKKCFCSLHFDLCDNLNLDLRLPVWFHLVR